MIPEHWYDIAAAVAGERGIESEILVASLEGATRPPEAASPTSPQAGARWFARWAETLEGGSEGGVARGLALAGELGRLLDAPALSAWAERAGGRVRPGARWSPAARLARTIAADLEAGGGLAAAGARDGAWSGLAVEPEAPPALAPTPGAEVSPPPPAAAPPPPPRAAAPPPRAPTPPRARPRALVADPSPIARRFLARLLRERGMEVEEIADAMELRRSLARGAVELVFADPSLAPEPGPGDPPAPALYLLASDAAARRALRRRGSAGVLIKPVAADEVEAILGGHRRESDIPVRETRSKRTP